MSRTAKSSKVDRRSVTERAGSRERRYLFVYGTLMKGFELHSYLRDSDAEFVGLARIKGKLYNLAKEGYPGAVQSAQRGSFIHGELYFLKQPDKALRKIDEVEGCEEGLFRRKLVDVLVDGRRVKGWTYFYAQPLDRAKLISSGRYR